jgi:hypothetical protein
MDLIADQQHPWNLSILGVRLENGLGPHSMGDVCTHMLPTWWEATKPWFKADDQDVVKNLVLCTPCHSKYGLYMFQRWSPNFNPKDNLDEVDKWIIGKHQGFKISTLIALRQVWKEFMIVAHEIATGIGEVQGANDTNDSFIDPRFCAGRQRSFFGRTIAFLQYC